MNESGVKAGVIALWFVMGCGQSEVRNGSRKTESLSQETSQSSEDAQKAIPKPEAPEEPSTGSGQSEAVDHTKASKSSSDVPDKIQSTPEPGQAPGKSSLPGSGTQEGQPPSPTPEASSAPAPLPPAPPPEIPLQPSKLGWNGTQLIGTAQLYFLPLD